VKLRRYLFAAAKAAGSSDLNALGQVLKKVDTIITTFFFAAAVGVVCGTVRRHRQQLAYSCQ
jgi:hypothetical protein